MGLLDAVGAGLNVAAEQSAKVGMAYVDEQIQAARDARLEQARAQFAQTQRDLNKADAAEERGRVQSEAQAIADTRGGLLSQSATDAYTKLGETDPEGAKLGLDAVAAAKADGGYAQTPTTRDMMLAKGDYAGVARSEENDADNKRQDARDKVSGEHSDRDFKLREKQFAQSSKTAELQLKAAQLAYENAVEEKKLPPAVKLQYTSLKERMDNISKAIYKAQAENNWNLESGKPLIDEQATIAKEMKSLMDPYMPEGAKTEKPKTDRPPLDSFGQKASGANAVVTKKPAPAAPVNLNPVLTYPKVGGGTVQTRM